MTRWYRAGLLGAAVLAMPTLLAAQSRQGFVPGWELNGRDFHSNGVWRPKGRAVAQARASMLARGDMAGLAAARSSGPNLASVTGVLRVPAILFAFQNSAIPQPFTPTNYNDALFSSTPPVGRPYTLRTFYEQLSNGAFSIQGDATNWIKLSQPEASYTGDPGACQGLSQNGNCNGVWSGASTLLLQTGLAEAIDSVDATIDFALYDNDGPDGVPNSGDDDGFVDIVMFLHAEMDGACGGTTNNHPWAHRYQLLNLKNTNDARAGGGVIRIRDYYIQSAVGGSGACTTSELMGPGTAAHELGHGLGLPDLYDTQSNTEGIGQWGLMGSGNYTTSFSPSRMEAWSLNQMGWVTLRTLSSAGTYTLGAAATSDTAFLIQPVGANPRNNYWLVENRQPVESDSAVIRVHCGVSGNFAGCGGGLLIWHVDGAKMNQGGNALNSGAIHGLELEQADGVNNLRLGTTGQTQVGRRGDAGDLYPGKTSNTVFGPTSTPAARLNNTAYANGGLAGFQIDQIAINAGVATMRLQYASAVVIGTQPALTAGVMGTAYSNQLTATGGLGDFTWTVTVGTLPPGLSLTTGGLLAGTPTASGTYNFTVQAASGGNSSTLAATLNVTQPSLVSGDVVAHIINGNGTLSANDLAYLDLLGNKNGSFDVGDFLAWVRATGAVGALREFEAAQRGTPTRTAKEK
ncbi:MAG TPA: M6 family metalloprotease domain-containing protein [Gemmatimonadales bacterium]|nr:M6 family metalloprotease domain-containing protein [Gemmatimonadales bacterium]